MKHMTTLKNHERRITTLEELARNHGDSIYQLKRMATKQDLRWTRMFAHFGIEDVADDEADEVLDAE